MQLTFLGAAKTVTGSKTLLEIGTTRILVDCGMYQGSKEVEQLNLASLHLDFTTIDFIFLTHAHFDHSGYLPVLVKHGFNGRIFCSDQTMQLARVILEDSARIQQYKWEAGESEKLLYTEDDVAKTMGLFDTKKIGLKYKHDDLSYEFFEAGHILGATSIVFTYKGTSIGFSGDLGKKDDFIHKAPHFPCDLDYLVLESTYGNRIHPDEDVKFALKESILRTKGYGGVLLIPAFAVARTQIVVQVLAEIFEQDPSLKLPVFVDSPMAIRATKIYVQNTEKLKVTEQDFVNALEQVKFLEFGNDIKKFERKKPPFILISASGMISGGRVLKHFDMYAKHEKNIILLVGFQGENTIGRRIWDGERKIKLFGHTIDIRAQVKMVSSLSAHADKIEMKQMISENSPKVKKIFLNHGEEESLNSFKDYLSEETDWQIEIAEKNKIYELLD